MSSIAAVCIVKNEEHHIAEWIAYQLSIGFDTIILYDNQSTDGTAAQARALAANHDIRIIDWPDTSASYQTLSYEHAARTFGAEFDWMAFFDSDEFLVIEPPFDLRAILNLWTDAAAIAIPWAIFGSSGHTNRPDGLLIEAFQHRAPPDFGPNRHIKSIIRPARMIACHSPHVFQMDGPYRTLTGNPVTLHANTMLETTPDYTLGKLHHYFTRSRAHWDDKMRRGYHDTSRMDSEFNDYDRNEDFDPGAARHADAIHAILSAIPVVEKPQPTLRERLWRGIDPFAAVDVTAYELDLQGWGSNHEYLSSSIERLRPQLIIEIGVWKGGSTVFMANKLRELGLNGAVVSIDTWLGAWDHWLSEQWFGELGLARGSHEMFRKFISNVKKLGLQDRVIPLPLDSINASVVLGSLGAHADIIHIDGGHDYTAVTNDLVAWWQVLRPGGMMIGDDYDTGGSWPDVRRAFDDFVANHAITDFEYGGNKCRFAKPDL